MQKLTGKVAIVTGSSKGIGAGIAERLAADGASVIVNYARSSDMAQAVVDRITAAGGSAFAIKADISNPAEIPFLVRATIEKFGKLDILINNAAVYKMDSLDSLTAASIDEHFALNVRGLLLMTQAAVRELGEGGVIVNLSSGMAQSPYPTVHAYCSTKGAVNTLTRSLALELGSRKIRVVGIAPGFTATEGNADIRDVASDDYLIGKTPLGRIGEPTDIAAAVSFAVSTDAGWITGSTVDVAGGMIF